MGGKQGKHSNYNYNRTYSHGYQSPSNFSPSHGSNSNPDGSKLQRRHARIRDNYKSLDEVTSALAQAGLESSNLIVGIDFTKSNEWTGARSFHKKSLHHLGDILNPYEYAISIIGRTLSAFDEDNLIPCFGFGDATTHDQGVFSFNPENRPCNGFEDALTRYREIVPHVRLAGPTSFAPIIETAIGIVDNSGGQYHVLLIIADGQVTRSVETSPGQLSPQERSTVEAIVRASEYPLSIIVVGVGDGPWDMMHQLDDNIPARAFDNIQFVNFTEIMSRNVPIFKKETEFALAALMEIPLQYGATLDLNLLGKRRGYPGKEPLPPPVGSYSQPNSYPSYFRQHSFEQNAGMFRQHSFEKNAGMFYAASPTSTESSSYNRTCPVCFMRNRDLAFGCGHQTCYECGKDLPRCPVCRINITTRIRLYD